MNLTMEVEAGGWQSIAGLAALIEKVAAAVLPSSEVRSVHILFTDDEAMREINREWRGKDKPTNVLSFPAAPQPVPEGEVAHLGDLVLAWETVSSEASSQHKSLKDHTSHLVVHGLLHLQGYDHEAEAEADVMEQKERDILASLGIADPYQS